MKKLNVISLFDGMSCGQIALDQLGIKPRKYYASEIDKYAIAVTQHNYPETIQLGDIMNWREWDIDWSEIDLIYGGSPCQGFSFAGKQLAFDDPRSKLFFVFVDIVNHIKKVNPNVKFLLENVRMKKEYLDIISKRLGVQPVKINSALVSAQNRVRYYWTNIAELEQPEDIGILLKDILETNTDESFNLNEKNMAHLNREFGSKGKEQTGKDKCCTVTASMGTGGGNVPYINRCIQVGEADIKGHDQIKRVYSPDGKAPTVTTCEGGHREPKVIVDRDRVITRCIQVENKTQTKEGKSYCVTARYDCAVPWNSIEKKQRTMIPTGESDNSRNDYKSWRKLTPKECERLQTVPDDYTLVPLPPTKNGKVKMMSNSQRYKMLGNGWTVEVIKHIFKNL